jgi:hypothetical protein
VAFGLGIKSSGQSKAFEKPFLIDMIASSLTDSCPRSWPELLGLQALWFATSFRALAIRNDDSSQAFALEACA